MESFHEAVAKGVASELGLETALVSAALRLLEEGWAIPYLARYRREAVGGLDAGTLRSVRDAAGRRKELERRREFILRAIEERGQLTPKLRRRIERCDDPVQLEYLYEPYRPPRKTPGSLARDAGLEPLAHALLKGGAKEPSELAAEFLNPELGVPSAEVALLGAREILAERFAVDPEVRSATLRAIQKEGVLRTEPPAGAAEIDKRYSQLRGYKEPLRRIPAHRYLHVRRAEREGAIQLALEFPHERIRERIARRHYPQEATDACRALLDDASEDAIALVQRPVLEDAHNLTRERSESEAISAFCNNLEDLLLFPPAGARRVMGIDPAPRGSIPFACVDERGEPLEHARLKPFHRDDAVSGAAREEVCRLIRTHRPELIALGNGTGRHEVSAFLLSCFAELGEEAPAVVTVSEAGVNAYASGPVGRGELKALPVPIRGAVSLARRLMDPLSELTKLDPVQVAIGPYQSDLDPARLSRALAEVVEHCTSVVGVDVNRASAEELASVCGLSTGAARAIAATRERQGPFLRRTAVAELPEVTERAFLQAGGFLRIHGGENPLDATGVHPLDEPLVRRIAEALSAEPGALVGNADLLANLSAEEYADETHSPAAVAGILSELLDGGRDPRPPLEVAQRPAGVTSPSDLKPGMRISGRVTNVTGFGAFVDLGVGQDGLVHVSQLADRFVKDPSAVVGVGHIVSVRVLGVDEESGRISLSMKSDRPPRDSRRREKDGRRPPRRGGPGRSREDRRPRRREEEAVEEIPRAAPAAPPEETEKKEEPIPENLSEEEFMKRKLEELKRRFG